MAAMYERSSCDIKDSMSSQSQQPPPPSQSYQVEELEEYGAGEPSREDLDDGSYYGRIDRDAGSDHYRSDDHSDHEENKEYPIEVDDHDEGEEEQTYYYATGIPDEEEGQDIEKAQEGYVQKLLEEEELIYERQSALLNSDKPILRDPASPRIKETSFYHPPMVSSNPSNASMEGLSAVPSSGHYQGEQYIEGVPANGPRIAYRVQLQKRFQINKSYSTKKNQAIAIRIISYGLFAQKRYQNIYLLTSLNCFYYALKIADHLHQLVPDLAMVIRFETAHIIEHYAEQFEGRMFGQKLYSKICIKLTRSPTEEDLMEPGYSPGKPIHEIENPLTGIIIDAQNDPDNNLQGSANMMMMLLNSGQYGLMSGAGKGKANNNSNSNGNKNSNYNNSNNIQKLPSRKDINSKPNSNTNSNNSSIHISHEGNKSQHSGGQTNQSNKSINYDDGRNNPNRRGNMSKQSYQDYSNARINTDDQQKDYDNSYRRNNNNYTRNYPNNRGRGGDKYTRGRQTRGGQNNYSNSGYNNYNNNSNKSYRNDNNNASAINTSSISNGSSYSNTNGGNNYNNNNSNNSNNNNNNYNNNNYNNNNNSRTSNTNNNQQNSFRKTQRHYSSQEDV